MALFKPANTTYKTKKHNSFIDRDSMVWLRDELLNNENSMFDYIKRLVRASHNCKIRENDLLSAIKDDTGEEWGHIYTPKYGEVEEFIRGSENSGLEFARSWIILAEEEMMTEDTKKHLTTALKTEEIKDNEDTKGFDPKIIFLILIVAVVGGMMFYWKK